jgi:hypothetical protein
MIYYLCAESTAINNNNNNNNNNYYYYNPFLAAMSQHTHISTYLAQESLPDLVNCFEAGRLPSQYQIKYPAN